MIRWLDRAGLAAALLLPLFLLHGRGIAEGLVVLVAAAFLARSALVRDWAWLRAGWVRIGLAWWGWLVLCSALAGPASLGQALGVVRFLLLVAALECWLLRSAAARLWLARLLRWAALYIAVQSLVQFTFGRNLFGQPRGADGELTGPYKNPRAGAPYSRLLFPALLPPAARWLGHQGQGTAANAGLVAAGGAMVLGVQDKVGAWLASASLALGLHRLGRPGWQALGGVGLPLAAMAVAVLIGQRMPLLLILLGLFVTALLLPRLRGIVVAMSLTAAMLLTATSVLSPPTFYRLVTKFQTQMADFPDSHYGQIAARAAHIGLAHPILGTGFDGFRTHCAEPGYFGGWHGGDGGGAAMCVQHPHNLYMQAFVEGGVPGLLLFCALALAWLRGVAGGLWRDPDPLRVGLFVAALIHLWPVASSSAFTSMPLSGWFFVLLGLGLAEARAYMPTQRPTA